MPLGTTTALLLGPPAALGLAWVWRRDQRSARAARAELLAEAAGLLEGAEQAQDGLDYPTVRGRWRGLAVELRPIADTMALRKLPSLWLQVTLQAPTKAPGVLDVLLRPLGVEHWSPMADLAVSVPTPAGLPETAQVRLDREEATALLPVAQAHAAFLARPTAKELLVTPKGARLVVQLAEGERGSYLLFREARFPVRRVERAALEALLAEAAQVLATVREAMDGERPRLDAAA